MYKEETVDVSKVAGVVVDDDDKPLEMLFEATIDDKVEDDNVNSDDDDDDGDGDGDDVVVDDKNEPDTGNDDKLVLVVVLMIPVVKGESTSSVQVAVDEMPFR